MIGAVDLEVVLVLEDKEGCCLRLRRDLVRLNSVQRIVRPEDIV